MEREMPERSNSISDEAKSFAGLDTSAEGTTVEYQSDDWRMASRPLANVHGQWHERFKDELKRTLVSCNFEVRMIGKTRPNLAQIVNGLCVQQCEASYVSSEAKQSSTTASGGR